MDDKEKYLLDGEDQEGNIWLNIIVPTISLVVSVIALVISIIAQ